MSQGEAIGILCFIGVVLLSFCPAVANQWETRPYWKVMMGLALVFMAPALFRLWTVAIFGGAP